MFDLIFSTLQKFHVSLNRKIPFFCLFHMFCGLFVAPRVLRTSFILYFIIRVIRGTPYFNSRDTILNYLYCIKDGVPGTPLHRLKLFTYLRMSPFFHVPHFYPHRQLRWALNAGRKSKSSLSGSRTGTLVTCILSNTRKH